MGEMPRTCPPYLQASQVNGHKGESEGVSYSRKRPHAVFLYIFTTVLWSIQEKEYFQRIIFVVFISHLNVQETV